MEAVLNKLLSAFGVSGHEEEVRKVIIEELKDINCDVKEDKMGNLIIKLGAGNEKLMFCAHMDEIGLIATYIEDNGFIRVGSVGDFKPSDIVHNFVRFENGVVGKVGSAKNNPEIGDLFVDIGVSTREEALKIVREADTASFLGDAIEVEDKLIGPGLNNRIGCFILLRLIKELKETNKELYFVFSAQAELGGRGARAAAFSIEPDYAVVVDLEEAGDVIGGKNNIKLGKGPVLTVMDRSLIIHHEVKERLQKAAEEKGIALQYAAVDRITDGGTIHKEGIGIKTGVLSVPCRYNHTASEMVSLKDVEKAIELLKEVIN